MSMERRKWTKEWKKRGKKAEIERKAGVSNGGRLHVPLGKRERSREGDTGEKKKGKFPGVRRRRDETRKGGRGFGGPGCWQGCRNPREWSVPYYPDTPHIHGRGPHMAP